jgi:hypothetical protein
MYVCACVRVRAIFFTSWVNQTLYVPEPVSACRAVYIVGAAIDQFCALRNP